MSEDYENDISILLQRRVIEQDLKRAPDQRKLVSKIVYPNG